MNRFVLTLAIWAVVTSTAAAYVGDQWILGIHHYDVDNHWGGFTENVGAGYSGPHSSGNPSYFGNSYTHSSWPADSNPYVGDIARVYWELSGNSVNGGNPLPTTAELFQIDYFGVPQPNGALYYQPIEGDFNGSGPGNGEGQQDPNIPWDGQFGTNHQWLKPKDQAADHIVGEWLRAGPGPQADVRPPADGSMMWLRSGSWIYAKWDFVFLHPINRSWSALRLTQITGQAAPSNADYNGDGEIDILDYVVWRGTQINGEDGYDLWRSTYGTSPGGGANFAVPEPASVLIALIGFVCSALLTRRRA